MLPQVKQSSEVYGNTNPNFFASKIPIAGIAGDQQAALFGQMCTKPGMVKNTYGTGCFMLMNTGEKPIPSTRGMLTTMAYKFDDQPAVYALEGSIAIAGALVQWLRDNLGIIEKSEDIEPLARSVQDSGGIYFVPAFSGLFAPYWRADARGVIVGMTRYINKGHIARAALDATAYQTREVIEAMKKDSGVSLSTLKVDGGMVKNDLLMQFQSDILGTAVVRPKISETTALGAAYAAGLAVGFWSGLNELKENWGVEKDWVPLMDNDERDQLYHGWLKAVTRTFNWEE
jgi:glycerol kinase